VVLDRRRLGTMRHFVVVRGAHTLISDRGVHNARNIFLRFLDWLLSTHPVSFSRTSQIHSSVIQLDTSVLYGCLILYDLVEFLINGTRPFTFVRHGSVCHHSHRKPGGFSDRTEPVTNGIMDTFKTIQQFARFRDERLFRTTSSV